MINKNLNMEQYKVGETIRVRKHGEDAFETWTILSVSNMKTSGRTMLRVRHLTGFVGTLMVHDIAKIEKRAA